MAVDTTQLQVRTKAQLLEDFAGANEGERKLLNLIWSLFDAIEALQGSTPVLSVSAGNGIDVDNTDPQNPVVSLSA